MSPVMEGCNACSQTSSAGGCVEHQNVGILTHVHKFVPYPERHGFAEVRMVYCETCGETRIVESSGAANRTDR